MCCSIHHYCKRISDYLPFTPLQSWLIQWYSTWHPFGGLSQCTPSLGALGWPYTPRWGPVYPFPWSTGLAIHPYFGVISLGGLGHTPPMWGPVYPLEDWATHPYVRASVSLGRLGHTPLGEGQCIPWTTGPHTPRWGPVYPLEDWATHP